MKNNGTRDNNSFVVQTTNSEIVQDVSSLNEVDNQSLRNEQKLEYLSKLVQNVNQKIEKTDIMKKLVRKDGN